MHFSILCIEECMEEFSDLPPAKRKSGVQKVKIVTQQY